MTWSMKVGTLQRTPTAFDRMNITARVREVLGTGYGVTTCASGGVYIDNVGEKPGVPTAGIQQVRQFVAEM